MLCGEGKKGAIDEIYRDQCCFVFRIVGRSWPHRALSLLYTYMRMELVGQFDDGLLTKAKSLHALLRRDNSGKVEFEFSDVAMPEFNRSNSPEYFELYVEFVSDNMDDVRRSVDQVASWSDPYLVE